MTYRVTPETTAWQLLQAIRDVYKEPVSESTIRAYMEKFPAHSIFLIRPNVTLKDLMFGATYVQGLSPYKEGYLLDLSG